MGMIVIASQINSIVCSTVLIQPDNKRNLEAPTGHLYYIQATGLDA